MENIKNYIVKHKQQLAKYLFVYIIGICGFALLFLKIGQSNNRIFVERFITLPKIAAISYMFFTLFLVLMFYLLEKKTMTWYQYMFYGCMLFCISGVLLVGYLTHGESIRTMFHNDSNDALMDFYNSIQWGMNPYINKTIYPPLISAFFGLLGRFVLITNGPFDLRQNQMGIFVFGMYIIILYSLLIYAFIKFKQGIVLEKVLFVITMLLSLPFIFTYERGNSITIALLFLMAYVMFYQSSNKKVRLLAYIALGISTSIKIAPAIFGVLLLRERRFKDALIATIIGVVIFIAPFPLTDGNPIILMKNLQYTTNLYTGKAVIGYDVFNIGEGVHISLTNISSWLGRLFNINLFYVQAFLRQLILLLSIAITVFSHSMPRWKIMCMLSCLLVLYPGFTAIYNLIYMSIPLIMFLDSKPKLTKLNLMYMLLFLGIFIPGINFKLDLFKVFFDDYYPMRLMTAIECICMLVLAFSLLSEGVWILYKENVGKATIKLKIGYCIVLLLTIFGIYGWQHGFSKRAVAAFYPNNLAISNCSSGFVMHNGEYIGIQKQGELLLKTDEVMQKGFIINFLRAPEKNEVNNEYVDLYINDNKIKSYLVSRTTDDYIYIPAKYFHKNNNEFSNTMKVKVVRNDVVQNDDILRFSYMGPAQSVNEIKQDSYIGAVTKGFHRDNNKQLWIGNQSKVLFSRESFMQGVLVHLKVPDELILEADKAGKELEIAITLNGRKIKSVPIDRAGDICFGVDTNDLPPNVSDNYFDIAELGIDSNVSYNENKMLGFGDKLDRSTRVLYIGQCKEPYYLYGPVLNKNKDIFIPAAYVEHYNLIITYNVPRELFYDRKSIKLNVFLDNQLIKSKTIINRNKDYLDAVEISKDLLAQKNGLLKIRLSAEPSSKYNDSDIPIADKIVLRYIGPSKASSYISGDTSSETGLSYISEGFEYDKIKNAWYMGQNAKLFVLKLPVIDQGLHLRYYIDQHFLDANSGDDIKFSVFANDFKLMDVPINKAGNQELYISPEKLMKLKDDGYDFINLEFISNSVYNMQNMRLSHAKEYEHDRSIGFTYIGRGPLW